MAAVTRSQSWKLASQDAELQEKDASCRATVSAFDTVREMACFFFFYLIQLNPPLPPPLPSPLLSLCSLLTERPSV